MIFSQHRTYDSDLHSAVHGKIKAIFSAKRPPSAHCPTLSHSEVTEASQSSPYLQGRHAYHLVGVIEEGGQDIEDGGFRKNEFL